MRRKVFELKDYMYPITVVQTSRRRFTVTYGVQVTTGLTLDKASEELGASIMHLMSCEGKIDNEE